MSDAPAFTHPAATTLLDQRTRLTAQTDMLIDAITGARRAELEGLPVAMVFARLCAQLRAMGLRPDEPKVLRIARWISTSNDADTPGSAAA